MPQPRPSDSDPVDGVLPPLPVVTPPELTESPQPHAAEAQGPGREGLPSPTSGPGTERDPSAPVGADGDAPGDRVDGAAMSPPRPSITSVQADDSARDQATPTADQGEDEGCEMSPATNESESGSQTRTATGETEGEGSEMNLATDEAPATATDPVASPQANEIESGSQQTRPATGEGEGEGSETIPATDEAPATATDPVASPHDSAFQDTAKARPSDPAALPPEASAELCPPPLRRTDPPRSPATPGESPPPERGLEDPSHRGEPPTLESFFVDPDGDEPPHIDAILMMVSAEPKRADLSSPPNAFTRFQGISLLERSLRAANALELGPTTLLAPAALHARIRSAAPSSRRGTRLVSKLEEPATTASPGRVLIIDPCAVHDPYSLQRLARWRGSRVGLALSQQGSGLRVRRKGTPITRLSRDLPPPFEYAAGAISIPTQLRRPLLERGALPSLRELAESRRLGACVDNASCSTEVEQAADLNRASRRLDESLTLSGDGLLDLAFHRPASVAASRALARIPLARPALFDLGHLAAGLTAAFLASSSSASPARGFMALALLLAALFCERIAGDLARRRLCNAIQRRRRHAAQFITQLGLLATLCCWLDGSTSGLIAATVSGLGFALFYGSSAGLPDELPSRRHRLESSEWMEATLLRRSYLYLLFPLFGALVSDPNTGRPATLSALWVSAIAAHFAWISLRLSPPRREPAA